ncbi:MAG TPA: hypothetical protein VKB32_05970 [Actinomycetota bacterium]|nr:hypothetical protein [Actinomycetota bacterium]
MWNLFVAVLFLSTGTLGLLRRDRFVALNLEAYRRWPMLRRIPILGRGHASERYQRRLITFDAVFLIAMSVVYLILWVVSL